MQHDATNFRRAGIIVGILFIIATAFLFLGEVFYRSLLDSPDVLTIAAQNKSVITFGLMIELVCILAMPLIGAIIYPVLARVSVGMALTNKFALLSLSEAVAAGADPVSAESARMLIVAQNALGNTDGSIYNIIFGLGALCLYTVLYRARLIPRWISLWGVIAIIILLAIVIAAMFVELPSWAPLLVAPIAVQEMVMALWFIFRGFDFSALEAKPPQYSDVPS